MRRLAITIVIIIMIAGYASMAVENPSAKSPIGSPTAVPSAGRSSLVPNPATMAYGASGNMVMTGNVSGGKQFRGVVPYGSSYYSSSYSSPVDNFLRRSAGDPLATDRNPGVYASYYDPRRTVTTVNRGDQSGLVAPQLNPQGRVNPSAPAGLPQTANTPFSLQQRPLSAPPDELSRILERQMNLNRANDLLKTRIDINTLAKEEKKNAEEEPLKPETLLLPQLEQKTTQDKQGEKETTKEVPLNRYEQIRNQMLEDVKQQEAEAAQKKKSEQTKQESKAGQEPSTAETTGGLAAASEPKGKYKTFVSLAEAKAAEYMSAAQQFLKEGKFYKAADSFALAAVWQPENAATWAGQVGSLFAAGEYMSGAYYLSQTLIMRPKLAEQKIDPTVLMPDRDTFENRILEIATWQERGQSGELAFLMAYMLWQDGKVSKAQEAIARAQTLMPQDPAVKALAEVINPAGSKPAMPVVEDTAKEPNQPSRAAADVVKNTAVEPNRP